MTATVQSLPFDTDYRPLNPDMHPVFRAAAIRDHDRGLHKLDPDAGMTTEGQRLRHWQHHCPACNAEAHFILVEHDGF